MSSWRELAANVLAQAARPTEEAPPNLGRSDSPESTGLPPDIVRGLQSLAARPTPNIRNVAVWAEIVADAQRLASDGWAQQALGLGWAPRDLFGVGKRHSDEFEGLAVWLSGRRLVLLDATSAMAIDDPKRFFYNRRGLRPGFSESDVEVVPLWRFGER